MTSQVRFVTLLPRQGRPSWTEKHPLNLNQVMLAEEVAIEPLDGCGDRSCPPSKEAQMTDSANHLRRLREQAPLVHCITNYVAMNVAANTLLAVGASPAMVHTPEESGEFANIAGALTINMGTKTKL